MGNELITRDQLQSDLENLYNNKISPYLNGAVHAGFTPVGSLIFFDGATAPNNYLACDGTIYNIADYPELANHYETQYGSKNAFGGDGVTTFAVRDLQGEFIRCAGTNSHTGQGSGGDVGEHQDATEISNIFVANQKSFICYKSDINETCAITNYDKVISTVVDQSYIMGQREGYVSNDPARGTSRPTNTSMLICVAYKNIYIDAVIGTSTTEITNPQDKQCLTFDATTQKWVNGAGGMHEYSTTEKVVGTWIDGRPIYEKIIELNNASGFPTITNIIENANELIGSYDILFKRQAGNTYQSIGFFYSVNDYCFPYIAIDTSTHYIQFITCESGGTYSKTVYYRAVIRYTKTTDTPTQT